MAEGYWLRLPGDFCQALGYQSTLKLRKRWQTPGRAEIVEKLVYSRNSQGRTFFRTQVLFWMLAATDGPQNFSIRLLPGSTPRNDVNVRRAFCPAGDRAGANLLHYKELKLAMALRSTNALPVGKGTGPAFRALGEQCRISHDLAIRLMEELIAMTPGVVDKAGDCFADGYPMDVFEAITRGLRWSADRQKSLALET